MSMAETSGSLQPGGSYQSPQEFLAAKEQPIADLTLAELRSLEPETKALLDEAVEHKVQVDDSFEGTKHALEAGTLFFQVSRRIRRGQGELPLQ